MASERLFIQIDERGARVVARSMAGIGVSARQSIAPVGALKAAIAAVAGSVVLRQLGQLSDAFTVIQNRLRLVTVDQGNLNSVFEQLVSVSQRTRSSLQSNAELFSRVSLAARELGVSQREVLNFTESLNQAIKLSGATAVEAEAGLIQLSQGLASGALRGDELRSVLEQLPAVADVIAKSLGVTRGQLRLLGQDGKITADVVLRAFREAREELQNNFGKTVPTLAEGFVLLKNQLVTTVGQLNAAIGATGAFGDLMARTTQFIKDATPATISFAKALFGSLDPLEELTSGMQSFATILVTITSAVRILANTISTVLVTAFKTVGTLAGGLVAALVAATRGDFSEAGQILQDTFTDTFNIIAVAGDTLREELVDDASATIKRLTEIWDAGSREIAEIQVTVGKLPLPGNRSGPSGPSEDELKALKKQQEFLAGLRQEREELNLEAIAGDNAAAAIKLYRTEIEAAALGGAAFVQTALEIAAGINEQTAAIEQLKAVKADDELLGALESEHELLKLTNRERAIEVELRKLSTQATDAQRTAVADLAGKIFDQQEALNNQVDLLKAIAEESAKGVQRAFADFLFNPFEEGLDGLLASFVTTLHRMAAELLAQQLLKSFFSAIGGLGGGFGAFATAALGALGGRANGGPVAAGQPVWVGEKGRRELFVPDRSGTVVPEGRTGGAPPVVNVTPQIINVRDPSEIPTAIQTGKADKALVNWMTENRSVVKQILQG